VSRRNIASLVIGSITGILLIATWLYFNPVDEILAHYHNLNVDYIVIASLTYILAYFLRSWRWNLLIPPSEGAYIKPRLWQTWFYALGGNLINYLIPIRAGDVARAWFIKRNHNMPIMKALPSVFIDKSFDTLAILFVIVVLPFTAIQVSSPMLILLGLLMLVFILTFSLLLFAAWHKELVIRVIKTGFAWLPAKAKVKLFSMIELFINGLNLFDHHPLKLISAVLLTALGVLLDGLYFFFLFKAFAIPIAFPLALFGYTLINLSYALPQPPAQLGSNEWMMIVIFSVGFGLTKSGASAIMSFAHILTSFLMLALGAVAFAFSGKEIISKIFKGEKIDDEPKSGN
jgi:uncharacterized protein (TIRG00374 family)